MANMLFDKKGNPASALLDVLRITGVDHDGTLMGIRNSTQSTWYQSGKIRANIGEEHGDLKTALMPLFMKLGLMEEVKAKDREYDNVLLLGATLLAVRKRLAFLMREWNRGVRFQQIVLLGSGRPLTEKESAESLFDSKNPELPFDEEWAKPPVFPGNEGEMMWMVYDQAASRFPWKNEAEVIFCIHPGKANTEETILHWMEVKTPLPGKCLAVSSQPFVGYQELTVRKVLPDSFLVEAIGYGAPPSIPVTVFLDNLAKVIYELAG